MYTTLRLHQGKSEDKYYKKLGKNKLGKVGPRMLLEFSNRSKIYKQVILREHIFGKELFRTYSR
jgi:hypothetical protein